MLVVAGLVFLGIAVLSALRPDVFDEVPSAVTWVAAAAAAIVLGTSAASPTGSVPVDALLRAAGGAAVVLAAPRARASALVCSALIGAAAAWLSFGPVDWVVGAGLGLAIALAVFNGIETPLVAVAAALVLCPLGDLDWPVFNGASTLAVVLVGLPLLVSGTGGASPRARRVANWATGLLVLVAIGGTAAGAVAAAAVQSDLRSAIDLAEEGLESLEHDDREAASTALAESAELFEDATGTLESWWARPALVVPGVAQHYRTVHTMAEVGADLTAPAALAVEQDEIDELGPTNGQVDLAALEELTVELEEASSTLRDTEKRLVDVRTPWLVPLLSNPLDELIERVDEASASATRSVEAARAAPWLLGDDGPRRYFLVLQSPAELRGVGGYMGSWGEVVINGGRVGLARTGRVAELTEGGPDPAARRIEGQPEYVERYGQDPAHYWGLIGFSPDFPTVASIIEQLYPESGGARVDGVISIDPAAFAAFLELTGPISVPGYAEDLTEENAEQILLHQQYIELGGVEEDAREDFFADATEVLVAELTTGPLPGPGAIADALGPAIAGRHLQLWAADDGATKFFESVGATGSARRTTPDSFGVVTQNQGGNKIDYFLRRSIAYDVEWDPETGAVDGTMEVRLTNTAPTTGLPTSVIGWGGDESLGQPPVSDGENLMLVSLYSPFEMTNPTLDRKPFGMAPATELGHEVLAGYVSVPSGETRRLRVRVSGSIRPGSEYRVEALRQVTAVPDRYQVRVRVASPWSPDEAIDGRITNQAVTASWSASTPQQLEIHADPPDDDPSILERLQGV